MAAAATPLPTPTPDSAEQLRRRANRRLLGASILLLIAIIAVPMFLEREPPPLPDNVDVRIPPVEGTKFEPKFPSASDPRSDAKKSPDKPTEIPAITEPTGAQAAAGAVVGAVAAGTIAAAVTTSNPAPQVATKPAIEPAKPAPEAAKSAAVAATAPPANPAKPSETASTSATKSAVKPEAKPDTKEPQAADRKAGQLVVQVIAVRDPATAKQMYDKAKSLKFPVYTEKIDVSNGVVTRVRVGPYNTKQQAEAARVKLAKAGFEAKVLTLQ